MEKKEKSMNVLEEQLFSCIGNVFTDKVKTIVHKYGLAQSILMIVAVVFALPVTFASAKGLINYTLENCLIASVRRHDLIVVSIRIICCIMETVGTIFLTIRKEHYDKDEIIMNCIIMAGWWLVLVIGVGYCWNFNSIFVCNSMYMMAAAGFVSVTLYCMVQYRYMKKPSNYVDETYQDKQKITAIVLDKINGKDYHFDGVGRESISMWETANFINDVGRSEVIKLLKQVITPENLTKYDKTKIVFDDKSGKLSKDFNGILHCEIRMNDIFTRYLLISIYPKKQFKFPWRKP